MTFTPEHLLVLFSCVAAACWLLGWVVRKLMGPR